MLSIEPLAAAQNFVNMPGAHLPALMSTKSPNNYSVSTSSGQTARLSLFSIINSVSVTDGRSARHVCGCRLPGVVQREGLLAGLGTAISPRFWSFRPPKTAAMLLGDAHFTHVTARAPGQGTDHHAHCHSTYANLALLANVSRTGSC
jgi:hypothetical protein